ncbi:GUstatory Receptor family [Ditylenchus destructor]|nr:GUstatory Receptor family [Ditylenchus destructor]
MASLTIELSEFNSQLNEEFTVSQPKLEEGTIITAPQVLSRFKCYTHLTEKLKATHDILSRQIPNWIDKNEEVTRIIKRFTDFVAQSSAALYGTINGIGRNVGFILGTSTIGMLNLDTIELLGWHSQSFFSIVFLIYWQWSGALEVLSEKVLLKESARLKRWFRILRILILVSMFIIMCNVTYNVLIFIENQTCIGTELSIIECALLTINVFGQLFKIHYVIVVNVAFCIFVVSMASLIMELSEFNSKLNEEFAATQSQLEEGTVITAPQVLIRFKFYTHLTDKVGRVDNIFNLYIFATIACSLSTAIIAPIKLFHADWHIALLFRIHDTIPYKLCGLCLLPAQVFTQVKATHDILSRQIPNWIEKNEEVARTIKRFTDFVAQSNAGITVGGMIVITKSLILTCLYLIVPNIVLCLQLKAGNQNETQSQNVSQI